MEPLVRLPLGLLHGIPTPAEAAGPARSAFPRQAIALCPQANRPKCYDSSSLLLFSPALLNSYLQKANTPNCDCATPTPLSTPPRPTTQSTSLHPPPPP